MAQKRHQFQTLHRIANEVNKHMDMLLRLSTSLVREEKLQTRIAALLPKHLIDQKILQKRNAAIRKEASVNLHYSHMDTTS